MTTARKNSPRRWLWRALTAAAVLALALSAAAWREHLAAYWDSFDSGTADAAPAERIYPLRRVDLPKVTAIRAVTRHLWRSYAEWPIQPDPREKIDAEALKEALAAARRRVEDAKLQDDFEALVENAVASGQIFWALQQAVGESGTRYFEQTNGHAIMKRLRALAGEEVDSTLRVEASVVIRSVSIPDASKDEIRLDMIVNSGAPIAELVQYMAANKMIAKHDAPAVLERWKRADSNIGEGETERLDLAKCLGVSFANAVEQREVLTYYNYGPYSGYIWRDAQMTVTIPARFNTGSYPFDATLFTIALTSSGALDASRLMLAPYARVGPPLDPQLSAPPRGFHFTRQTPVMIPVSVQDNSNALPRPALLYSFQLARRLDTSVWRTFVPLFLIVAFSFVATARALATREHIGAIMTSLLPTLTVACVALQLTASTAIPAHSGGTVMDKIFVCIYLQLFFLFMAANTHHLRRVSRLMLAASCAAIVYCVHFFF